MTPGLQYGSNGTNNLKSKDDYARTVLLTELLADHLPRLPWFLKNLQCALDDSSTVLEKVCSALEAHPKICADFVRISGLADPVQPISVALDQLVVLLGKERVWNTALAAFLLHELNSSWSSPAQKAVASIAITRANYALVLAGEIDESDAEQVYVSEILSIIGLLPLLHFCNVEDQLPEWLDVSADAAGRQREIFGTDFLELGRWTRLLWKLPLENTNPEVIFQAPQTVSNSQILPKNIYSPLAALNVNSEGRNLVLVSKGTV